MSIHEDLEVPRLLLTPVEVAHALSIGRTKVYELMLTNALDSVKIGTLRRIPADAVVDFVRSLRVDSPRRNPNPSS
ncbi:MAG: DNA-binding protein [Actinobacteria bacterium]|nr:DNA-binding protein [Actinomycetota bacterium]